MHPSASKGGDIGLATKESMAPEYSEAAFSLPVGGIGLVRTQYGYHILKVTDRKKEGLATLEEVAKTGAYRFLKAESPDRIGQTRG